MSDATACSHPTPPALVKQRRAHSHASLNKAEQKSFLLTHLRPLEDTPQKKDDARNESAKDKYVNLFAGMRFDVGLHPSLPHTQTETDTSEVIPSFPSSISHIRLPGGVFRHIDGR